MPCLDCSGMCGTHLHEVHDTLPATVYSLSMQARCYFMHIHRQSCKTSFTLSSILIALSQQKLLPEVVRCAAGWSRTLLQQ